MNLEPLHFIQTSAGMNTIYAITLLLLQIVAALKPAEWRNQSIYFLMTDRFGRTDNSTTALCDVDDRVGAA